MRPALLAAARRRLARSLVIATARQFAALRADRQHLFQIKNRLNCNIREKSGSKCIIKFPEIGVLDGQRITHDPVEKEKLLTEIIERHKKEQRARIRKEIACQVSVGLQGKEALQAPVSAMRDISNKVYYHAEDNGLLTPKQFSLFVWAAQIAKIEVPLTVFQGIINLRKGMSKNQLDGLHWRQIENIKGALTPSQLTILERERKRSPPG